MGTTLDAAAVKISADIEDLKKSFSDAKDIAQETSQNMQKSFKEFSENSSHDMLSFQNVLGTALGVFSGEALIEAVHKVGEALKEVFVDQVKEDIAAAEKQQDAIQRMNVALAQAGNLSAESSRSMQEFAESIQDTTKFSKDATLQGAAYIETLTKLDEDGLKKATAASVDFAAATGVDLHTAVALVSRAIEGHSTGLQRLGIDVDTTGTKEQNLANVLQALSGFHGAAAAQANTFSGAMQKLANNQEESHAALGQVIVGNQAFIGVINTVSDIVKEHTHDIEQNVQEYKLWAAEGLIVVIKGLEGMAATLSAIEHVAQTAFEVLTAGAKIATGAILAAALAARGDLSGAMEHLKETTTGAFDDIKNAALKENVFDKVGTSLSQMQGAAERGYAQIESGASQSTLKNQAATAAVKALSDEMTKAGQEGAKLAKATIEKDDPEVKLKSELKSLKVANDQKLISHRDYLKAQQILNDNYEDEQRKDNQSDIDDLIARNKNLETIGGQQNLDEVKANKAKIAELKADEDERSDYMIKLKAKEVENERTLNNQRLQAGADTFGQLAQFQNAKTKEIAEVGKAAAIAQTTIDTYRGAAAAAAALAGLGPAGPVLAAAAAAAFVAAGLARVAQIEGVQLASGIDSVPGIGTGDSVPAVLTPGERVVPQETNKDLTSFLSGNSKMNALLSMIGNKIDQLGGAIMNTPTIVNVGGKTIAQTLRQEIRNGRQIFS